MSSIVSCEVLRDILLPLDRWTLDDVQFTNGRFLDLITQHMSDVCLRQVDYARFDVDSSSDYVISIDGQPERNSSHNVTAHLFAEFVRALGSSRVELLGLNRLDFTPDLVALILQTPIVIDALSLYEGSCIELTATQFHDVLLHLSPTSLLIRGCLLRANQFPDIAPVNGDNYHVTDDVIVDFFLHQDVQEGEAAPNEILYGELDVRHGSFTKGLFKRLVEASYLCKRTQSLRIAVSPVRFEQEDLRNFTQHLSYRRRGTQHEERIYDFPIEHQGAVKAMHLQIRLHADKRLELIRARPPHIFFHKSDE